MVTRLEDKLYKQQNKGRSYIDFEKNDLLKGLQYIDPLHKAIIKKQPLEISYKSFKAQQAGTMIFHPYLLKEYRNRWFILGMNTKGSSIILNLALDRIEDIQEAKTSYLKPSFDIHSYYTDVIGVTKLPSQPAQHIIIKVARESAPYIITKPLHSSQKLIKETNDWIFFSIDVVLNYELEKEIMGFGEQMKVVSPHRLRSRIKSRLKKTLQVYEDRD
jgi:predicted DNA-binding transcriptional regulator YafY